MASGVTQSLTHDQLPSCVIKAVVIKYTQVRDFVACLMTPRDIARCALGLNRGVALATRSDLLTNLSEQLKADIKLMSQSQQLGDHFSEKLSASELAADAAAYPKFMSGAISTSNSTPNARFLSQHCRNCSYLLPTAL
jgi:hypothetical protein